MTNEVPRGPQIIVGSTATGASTAAKVVALDYPWNLRTPTVGDLLLILFPNGNTAASMTLAINGATAVPVQSAAGSTAAFTIVAKSCLLIINRGSYFQAVGSITTTPTLTALKDINGNTEISFTATANAVNDINVLNAAAGTSPIVFAEGADTDVDFNIAAKNGGYVKLRAGGDGIGSKQVLVAQSDTNPVNFASIKNSNTGSAVRFAVDGADTNVGLNLVTKNAGLVFINSLAALYSTGPLGTPSSGTLTNCTGLPLAGILAAAYASAATASVLAQRDANANLLANNFIPSQASTVTAAGTTTLTIADKQVQVFTGSSTQTLKLPTTGVIAGQTYTVINQSTGGSVTVQSSGANTIQAVTASRMAVFEAKIDTPTTSSDWQVISSTVSLSAVRDSLASRDGNANLLADAFVPSLTSTPTAATTTTLTVDSTEVQLFTGSTTQTCALPTTGVVAGQRYTVINTSSGAVTVNASGGATVATLSGSTSGIFVALQATPTTAAHWFKVA